MPRAREQRLLAAGWLFAAGSAVHIVDHLRRGQGSISDELYWLGNLGLVLQVAVVTLIVVRHPVAPVAAVSAGVPLAIGFAAAHWLPHWSAISDPVWQVETLRWFSAFASGLEVAGAAAIAVTGWSLLRQRGLAATVRGPSPPRGGPSLTT